jgi:hypothetical protein
MLSSQYNLSLPDTKQQININVVLVDDLNQFFIPNGAQYLNLQERIGKDFYKLPSQMLAEDGGFTSSHFIAHSLEKSYMS